MKYNSEILIIGSGISGMSIALKLSKKYKVNILTKNSDISDNNSQYAQGGIAAVLNKEDSINKYSNDIVKSGISLFNKNIIHLMTKKSKSCIKWLIKQGVKFNKENNNLHLLQEGGHSLRRIVHHYDETGKEIIRALSLKIIKNKNISIFKNYYAIKILKDKNDYCIGIQTINKNNNIICFYASKVILATGGFSSIYKRNTNYTESYGEGISLGMNAGCLVKNMEFIQFHPTCFYDTNNLLNQFLISESLRGEGGKLLLPNGKDFMYKYHKDAELAPRDIVSRAIKNEMDKENIKHVYLDISHKKKKNIYKLFPGIYNKCKKYNINIFTSPIPIAPAAHYTCGGIIINKYGQTNIKNLYSLGETSYSGIHGSNRIASTSLLECIFFSYQIYKNLKKKNIVQPNLRQDSPKCKKNTIFVQNKLKINEIINNIKHFMWEDVGIIRNKKKLHNILDYIHDIENKFFFKKENNIVYDNIKLKNILIICKEVISNSINRKKNVGVFYKR